MSLGWHGCLHGIMGSKSTDEAMKRTQLFCHDTNIMAVLEVLICNNVLAQ